MPNGCWINAIHLYDVVPGEKDLRAEIAMGDRDGKTYDANWFSGTDLSAKPFEMDCAGAAYNFKVVLGKFDYYNQRVPLKLSWESVQP